jgi:hypothetical protein
MVDEQVPSETTGEIPSGERDSSVDRRVWRSDALFRDFAQLLRKRLELRVAGSEDSIRYMLFAAMVQHRVAPEHIVMEYPHPGLDNKQIDTVVVDMNLTPLLAIEFKYHRRSLSGHNKPRTLAAGSLFKDIIRLAILEWPADRYLIYLTDDEMAAYLRSPRMGLSEIIELPVGAQLDLNAETFANLPATFFIRVGVWPGRIAIRSIVAQDLPGNHLLRIYEVGSVGPRA